MRSCLLLMTVALFASHAAAECREAQSVDERVACQVRVQCAGADSDAERLACYERVIRDIAGSSGVDQAEGVAAQAEAAEPAPPPAAEDGAEAGFGLHGQHATASASLDEIGAVIADTRQLAYGRLLMRLDNGQVWEEIDARRIGIEPGDEVRITRARFGSFRLIRREDNRVTTVQRLRCDTAGDRATRRKCEAMGH